jgi:hypothetical protein
VKRRYSAIICEVDCYDDILYTLEDPEQFIKSNPSLFKNKVFIHRLPIGSKDFNSKKSIYDQETSQKCNVWLKQYRDLL